MALQNQEGSDQPGLQADANGNSNYATAVFVAIALGLVAVGIVGFVLLLLCKKFRCCRHKLASGIVEAAHESGPLILEPKESGVINQCGVGDAGYKDEDDNREREEDGVDVDARALTIESEDAEKVEKIRSEDNGKEECGKNGVAGDEKNKADACVWMQMEDLQMKHTDY